MGRNQGWHNQSHNHGLASKGIKTKPTQFKAGGKRRFKKGDFVEVIRDYSFIEPHLGRKSNKPVTVKKGDIGRITYIHKDDLESMNIVFKTQDGKVFIDSTDKRFITGHFRKLKMSKSKDKQKVKKIFYKEE